MATRVADLDAVERQLREVAASVLSKPTTAGGKDHEALARVSRIAGRNTRSGVPSREHADGAPGSLVTLIKRKSPPVHSLSQISDAYQGRLQAKASMPPPPKGEQAPKRSNADSAQKPKQLAEGGSGPDTRNVRRFDHEARTFLAGAAPRLDGVERATPAPQAPLHPAIVKQSVMLRSARSLALPLLLLALGTGTAIVMLSPVGERPPGKMKDTQLRALVQDPDNSNRTLA
ncbi:MAG: hypothetical protein JOY97_10445, partial [Hyphomicrobiales bacterium]|nr:hypothetical protein [Hyphomicrobiales bacterium]